MLKQFNLRDSGDQSAIAVYGAKFTGNVRRKIMRGRGFGTGA